jgi:hypothetical protein
MMFRRTVISLLPVLTIIGCTVNPGSAPTAQELIQSQADSLAKLKTLGKVEEKQYPPGKGYVVDLSGANITDEHLAALRGVGTVAELDLSGATITDEQFAKLMSGEYKLNNLFNLDISNTPITDAGLSTAQESNLLAKINVKGSKVTDAGVKELTRARKLKKLPFGLKFEIEK